MPRGAYLLAGHATEVVERFSSGAGPLGWRYVATRTAVGQDRVVGRLDVVLDPGGAALRVQVTAGSWTLRGGVVGAETLWQRGGREWSEPAAGFTGSSPVWSVAAARRVDPAGAPVRLRLVRLGDEALSTLTVEEGWSCTGATEREGTTVSRYEVADLSTGERRVVQLAGGLVLEAPGVSLVELE